jgi:hypothetical protein
MVGAPVGNKGRFMNAILRNFLACLAIVVAACGGGSGGGGGDDDTDGGVGKDASSPDANTLCNPAADSDGDGIANELEGCLPAPGRDSDGDGKPDWLDDDADDDGLKDQYEDRDGDGKLGSCAEPCATGATCAAAGATCALPQGVCIDFLCLDGESDPLDVDTDGDGKQDSGEGTWVCNPPTETNSNGLKPFKKVSSQVEIAGSKADWLIALEPDALINKVSITGADPLDSGFLMDLDDPGIEVAGFLVTRAAKATDTSAVGIATLASEAVANVTGASASTLRASGTRTNSLDDYDTVLGTTVVLTTGSTDVTAVRKQVLQSLSGRAPAQVMVPQVGWVGANQTEFVVTFQTLFRTDTSQVVFMGAVTSRANYDDKGKRTGFHADDLSNGTGLTRSTNGDTVECETFYGDKVPKADIIWVLDESGSMSDDNANVAANAQAFFQQATTAGLDFRMGITAMNLGVMGKFAARDDATSTGDKWLGKNDVAAFQAGVDDPSSTDPDEGASEYGLSAAQSAVIRHVPRSATDAAKVRPDAKLVVLFITDEHPEEIEDGGILADSDLDPSMQQLSQIVSFLKPYIDTFTQHKATVHVVGVPPPYPSCNNGGEVGWGYTELASWFGGQYGSLCQPDLGATISAIITDVLGEASSIKLEWVPISATIAVTRSGQLLPRSRSMGWDYEAKSNAIVLHGIPNDPLNPAEIVVSYRRWSEQPGVE